MPDKQKEIEVIEQKISSNENWENREKTIRLNQRLALLKEEKREIKRIDKEIKDLEELVILAEKDSSIKQEVEKLSRQIWKDLQKQEIKTFLSGKYDKDNAILSIYSGAGGNDAQDWSAILLRMYQRYCQNKGWQTKILSQSFGELGAEGRIGIKEVSLLIKGKYSYGILKGETGVHRLVRISPFSAKKLRHTSFALVDVLPQLPDIGDDDINIREEDLRVDTYRASGPGGQYVNKRDSAIRITHLPTNVVVSCQAERTQGANRQQAMKILKAKLFRLKEKQEKEEVQKIKGELKSVEWGSQIRSYVLYPYKMVKDLRTKVETTEVEKVLDGDLDNFIEAEVRLKQTKV